jgi:hypothetical protein
MAVLQNPWKSRNDRSGTANQINFQSKPVGMNRPPDPVVASRNQPPSQRPFGSTYRMGNKRKSLGG